MSKFRSKFKPINEQARKLERFDPAVVELCYGNQKADEVLCLTDEDGEVVVLMPAWRYRELLLRKPIQSNPIKKK